MGFSRRKSLKMALKGKMEIFFFAIICAAGLAEAFNNDRTSSQAEQHDSVPIIEPSNLQSHSVENPVELTDTILKLGDQEAENTSARESRQRHDRTRRQWSEQQAMDEIFQRNVPLSNPNYNFNPYGMQSPLNKQQPYAAQSYLPPPGPSHITHLKNGNQVNHFHYPQPPVSPYNNFAPYFNFPSPFFIGNILFIPFPICFPNQAPNNVPNQPPEEPPSANPELPTDLNISLPPRSGLDEEIDYSVYYNTSTGVSLDTVRPLRPPTISNPPFDHSSPRGNRTRPNNQGSRPRPSNQGPPLVGQYPAPPQAAMRPPQGMIYPAESLPARPVAPQANRPYRPPTRPTFPPVVRPVDPPQALDSPDSPAQACIWAIVKCCAEPRRQSTTRCFEEQRCSGAFFENPCDSEVGRSISEAAKKLQQDSFLFS